MVESRGQLCSHPLVVTFLCPATAAVSTITRSTCFHHASTSTTSDAASDQNTYRYLVTVLSHSLDCVHMYLSILVLSSMQCSFLHFHHHFRIWVLYHIFHKSSGSSLALSEPQKQSTHCTEFAQGTTTLAHSVAS